jgi:hypothetical protein
LLFGFGEIGGVVKILNEDGSHGKREKADRARPSSPYIKKDSVA